LSRWRAALPLFLLVLTGIILFASGTFDRLSPENLVADRGMLHGLVAAHPLTMRLVYIGLLTLAVSTGIPGTVVIIFAGGLMFGQFDGTVCSSLALVLGSLLLFLASRYAFGTGSRHPPALVAKLRDRFASHPVSYTLFLRLVPVLPFGGMTVALAWLRCPLWLFLGATAVGGAVTTTFETSIGAGLDTVMEQGQAVGAGLLLDHHVLLPLGALALLALVPLSINAWRARRHRQ
jgi:uncharacterized membrane protein YdjX (TVP38/TMEM64 family)